MSASYRFKPLRVLITTGSVLSLLAFVLGSAHTLAADWPIERWRGDERAPDDSSIVGAALPIIVPSASWQICAIYPHLKDSYWHAVNFGMVEEAHKLGLGLRVLEAGGYEHLERQREQVEGCIDDSSVDALLVGTVSYAGLNDLLQPQLAARPVLALVNDIDVSSVRAKVGVPWYQLGWKIGAWLAERHPAGSEPVSIAWFPGPRDAGWVGFIDRGFNAALTGSAVQVVTVRWGDTGRSVQRQLVEDTLETHATLDYLVGNAPMAEVAVAELRRRQRENDVGIVASYVTPGVYGAIGRGRILASVTDFPVLQGRMALLQVLRALEGLPIEPHIGPRVELVEPGTLARYPIEWMMAPAGFAPVYDVAPAPAPFGVGAGARATTQH